MANRKYTSTGKGRTNKNSSSNKKSGNYKSRNRAKTSNKEDLDSVKSQGDINDASYYYGDANVLDQVMNFSFNEFGGVVTDLPLYPSVPGKIYNSMVATYWLNPAAGREDPTTAAHNEGINVASLRNFLILSGSNAKTTLYAPQDVTLLILALAEVIKVSTFIARALGVAYLFNYRNRTYPETLLLAMGIDPVTFKDNLARYRVLFNTVLATASRIPFPADIPIFKKASELYASIYMDDPSSALAQTYMFCPYSTWLFNETYDANGAGLDTYKIVDPNTPTDLGTVIGKLKNMVDALVTSTSLNTIYSDIMRLAQNGKIGSMITFNSIPEDFMVLPVYNEEVRTWIHNATIIGEPLASSAQPISGQYTNLNDVSCDASNNAVIYMPQWKVPLQGGYSMLLDFDHDQVSVEDKVKATRLSARWYSRLNSGDNKYYSSLYAIMDEYVVAATYYTGTHNYADLIIDNSFITPSTIANAIWDADVISKFDWAPLLYYVGTNNNIRILGDLDYYTTVDEEVLHRIYDYEIIHFLQIG